MNSTQYKNIIDYTVSHADTSKSANGLETTREILKNMGVPIPHGTCKEVYEILKTNDYMGWHSCTIKDARNHANYGTPAIGISEDRVVIISPEDTEEASGVSSTSSVMSVATRTVQSESSVMTLSDSTPALAVADLEYYAYSRAGTNEGEDEIDYTITGINSTVVEGWTGIVKLKPSITDTIWWHSGNPSVLDVSDRNGEVVTKKPGVAEIVAGSHVNGTNYKVLTRRTITVVSDEKRVVIEKDGNYFTITFADGMIWKSIGYDLMSQKIDVPQSARDRYFYNAEYDYTIPQLAYIYLFDPLGVEHYVRDYIGICSNMGVNMTIAEHLIYKDQVFKQIFGFYPKKIVSYNGKFGFVDCGIVTTGNRTTYHTQSEILFGFHNYDTINNWLDLMENVLEALFNIADLFIPNKEIQYAIECYQIFFFSASITEAFTELAKSFIIDYLGDPIKTINDLVGWAGLIVDTMGNLDELQTISNMYDIQIYNKIANQEYNTYFFNGNTQVSIEEIINYIS